MFNSSKKEEVKDISPQTYADAATIIARGVRVEGEFNSEVDVIIEGEVKGTLNTTASLTVGAESIITADIQAGTANVSGTIEGNIIVHGHLILKSSAIIKGDITAETVNVEQGAKLEGRAMIGATKNLNETRHVKRENDNKSKEQPSETKDGALEKPTS